MPQNPRLPPLKVLYEDNHLLVVVKPAGIATMGVSEDTPSLFTQAKAYVKKRYDKPGNVYLGVVSRLDLPVSGVTVFARTSKAAARLTEQFKERSTEKIYWAAVEGTVAPPNGEFEDYIFHNDAQCRMEVVAASKDAKLARLDYNLMSVEQGVSLVEVRLETGRKHQIRLQFASRGYPIVGDRKYGSARPFASGIALHARTLRLSHPVRREDITFTAELPDSWRRWNFATER